MSASSIAKLESTREGGLDTPEWKGCEPDPHGCRSEPLGQVRDERPDVLAVDVGHGRRHPVPHQEVGELFSGLGVALDRPG